MDNHTFDILWTESPRTCDKGGKLFVTGTFGYNAAQKSLQRLEADKCIERTMRGHFKKLVSELPTI